MPKISVVTINLNNAKGLASTIESVVNQTYTEIEYHVIDGGSNDGSQEIIKTYSENIDYWISEADNGIYEGMNKGIRQATGEIVCFLNSGDLYQTKYSIENVMAEILKSYAEIFFFNYHLYNTEHNKMMVKNIAGIQSKFDFLSNFFAHPSTFYKRNLFEVVGLFNTKYKIAADVDWYLNALINHQIGFAQFNYSSSIFFDDGISSNNIKKLQEEYQEIISKYFTKCEIQIFSGKTFKYINGLFDKKIIDTLFKTKLNKIEIL